MLSADSLTDRRLHETDAEYGSSTTKSRREVKSRRNSLLCLSECYRVYTSSFREGMQRSGGDLLEELYGPCCSAYYHAMPRFRQQGLSKVFLFVTTACVFMDPDVCAVIRNCSVYCLKVLSSYLTVVSCVHARRFRLVVFVHIAVN
ncbi:hypothetical protein RvY_05358-2 [Ramazzottius varieornatus]|uniref:Uncharacterized protein n=1 Tax=Ramazzottius varieornatus TaxID=947166 RepID=A0A1D1UVD1_RAMVA|nr:hypothetical protein RvY_05358-2 [Ramazzottius varieornatus]